MKDAFGAPQSLLVLGGTSRIALATARRLVAARTRTVRLAGRPSPALESAAEELRAYGADVSTVDFDALAPETHETVLGKVFAEGDIDVVLLAFGIAGDQERDEEEPLGAVRVAQTNYTGAVSAGLVCAGRLQAQGHGSLVVLSSVAGERARRADFIYGSSKAGLDTFAQGLGEALRGTGVHVMVVRPGVVRPKTATPAEPVAPRPAAPRPTAPRPTAPRPTPSRPMPPRSTPSQSVTSRITAARITVARLASYGDAASRIAAAPLEAPPLVTTPDAVATAIVTGLRRRSGTVWVPGALRVVMSALRHVPRPLFRHLPM
ncbi:SDR family NAD(P)-dependent oxidoreductase [Streptomyces sp. NPDC002476]|uniref:SDR family NAD(P)-dependent oxidoreductase n=1 Tax=Streptomyces sp. NPDC002476 TaxID=3364648 RepID=UPI0036AAD4FF